MQIEHLFLRLYKILFKKTATDRYETNELAVTSVLIYKYMHDLLQTIDFRNAAVYIFLYQMLTLFHNACASLPPVLVYKQCGATFIHIGHIANYHYFMLLFDEILICARAVLNIFELRNEILVCVFKKNELRNETWIRA